MSNLKKKMMTTTASNGQFGKTKLARNTVKQKNNTDIMFSRITSN